MTKLDVLRLIVPLCQYYADSFVNQIILNYNKRQSIYFNFNCALLVLGLTHYIQINFNLNWALLDLEPIHCIQKTPICEPNSLLHICYTIRIGKSFVNVESFESIDKVAEFQYNQSSPSDVLSYPGHYRCNVYTKHINVLYTAGILLKM